MPSRQFGFVSRLSRRRSSWSRLTLWSRWEIYLPRD
eukprot:CCRYP_006144-RC/>CCRYP_006144-RC protein AED:0.37 eAED:1.00 QI:0/-1/0/1/-1/0/1/0/35